MDGAREQRAGQGRVVTRTYAGLLAFKPKPVPNEE